MCRELLRGLWSEGVLALLLAVHVRPGERLRRGHVGGKTVVADGHLNPASVGQCELGRIDPVSCYAIDAHHGSVAPEGGTNGHSALAQERRRHTPATAAGAVTHTVSHWPD